jgi:hypothetical protein
MVPTSPLMLGCAPVLATAVLFLATARAWHPRRAVVEAVMLAIGLLLATAWLTPQPAPLVRALLPLAAVVAAWSACAYGAWRFAPDAGQRGWAWIFPASAARALPWSCGAAFAFTPFPWRCVEPLPLLFVTGLVFPAMLGTGGLWHAFLRYTAAVGARHT